MAEGELKTDRTVWHRPRFSRYRLFPEREWIGDLVDAVRIRDRHRIRWKILLIGDRTSIRETPDLINPFMLAQVGSRI